MVLEVGGSIPLAHPSDFPGQAPRDPAPGRPGCPIGLYAAALKGIDLSVAYPVVTGFAMLGIALAGSLLFGEAVTMQRLLAMGLIFTGVLMLKQGA